MTHLIAQADASILPLADQSVDLVVGSPPYIDARLYLENGRNLGIARKCAAWVEWMLDVTTEACRVSRGLVIWVCAGKTRDWCYEPGPEGLLWEWWKRGGQCWRPVFWHRVGIPGSGGKQWMRSDVEYCLAFKRDAGKIPWADNTACGHPPKWNSGGKLSYRDESGQRRHLIRGTSGYGNGDATYHPSNGKLLDRAITEIANPGNYIKTNNGGGKLGHWLAHENEAPYPEDVSRFFIKSVCPPGGIACDPFSGSGTTVSVAKQEGRRGIGFDLRMSQCLLAERRIATPSKASGKNRGKPELEEAGLFGKWEQ